MVAATTEAADAIRRLRAEEGELIFVQSDGCCDGSALMCFQAGEFRTGDGDALIAEVAGCPVYASRRQLAAWSPRRLLLDVEPGYADGFSLPAGDGLHFITRDVTHEPAEPVTRPGG